MVSIDYRIECCKEDCDNAFDGRAPSRCYVEQQAQYHGWEKKDSFQIICPKHK